MGRERERVGRVKYKEEFLGCICGSDGVGPRPLNNYTIVYNT